MSQTVATLESKFSVAFEKTSAYGISEFLSTRITADTYKHVPEVFKGRFPDDSIALFTILSIHRIQ